MSVSGCWDRELTGATGVKFSQCWIGGGGMGFGLRALYSWPCSSNHFDFFLHNNLNGLEWRMDPSTSYLKLHFNNLIIFIGPNL